MLKSVNTIQTNFKNHRSLFFLFFLFSLSFILLDVFYSPYNSDEFQHFHLAWQVLKGKTLYTELFDNHGPLFAYLNSFWLDTFGLSRNFKSLEILRYFNSLLLFAYLYYFFKILRLRFSKELTLFAIIFICVNPYFILTATDLRPDLLYNVLILVAVYYLLKEKSFRVTALMMSLAFFVHPKALSMIVILLLFSFFLIKKENFYKLISTFLICCLLLCAPLLIKGSFLHFLNQSVWMNFELALFSHSRENRNIILNHFLQFSPQYIPFFIHGLFLNIKAFRLKTFDKLQSLFFLFFIINLNYIIAGMYPYILITILPSIAVLIASSFQSMMINEKTNKIFIFIMYLCLSTSLINNYINYKNEKVILQKQKELNEKFISMSLYENKTILLDYSCEIGLFNDDFSVFWYLGIQYEELFKKNNIRQNAFNDLKLPTTKFAIFNGSLKGSFPEFREYILHNFKKIDHCIFEKI